MKRIKYVAKQAAKKVYLQFRKSMKSEKKSEAEPGSKKGGRPITNV